MPRYAELIYYGFWFSPEREMLQALIDKSQEHVEGEVRLKLYKGNVIVIGRASAEIALLRQDRHLRGRRRRLRPEGRARASSSSTRSACGCSANAKQRLRSAMWPDTRLLDLFGVELPIVAGADGQLRRRRHGDCRRRGRRPRVVALRHAQPRQNPCRRRRDSGRAATSRSISISSAMTRRRDDVRARTAWLERLAPYYAELGAEMPQLPLKAAIIAFSRGDLRGGRGVAAGDRELPFRSAGAGICSSASSGRVQNHQLGDDASREALWLAERGVDAIIAQGAEAGGHRGMFLETDVATQIGTFALVPQIVRCGESPGDCRRRHRRCARHRRRLRARRLGRADRHRLSHLPRSHDLRRCIARRWPRPEPRDRHHQRADRPPGARRSSIASCASKARSMRTAPAFPLATQAAIPLRARLPRSKGSGDFSPLLVRPGARLGRDLNADDLTRTIAEESLA